MQQTYYTDKTVNLEHLNDRTKLVHRNGVEVGCVFISPERIFRPRCYVKGEDKTFFTLTEAVDWILYSKG